MHASETMQVDTRPPFEMEVIREINFLKRRKAAAPDGLSPTFFNDGGEVKSELIKLLGSVWCELVNLPIYRKGDRFLCKSRIGISMASVKPKRLANITLRWLSTVCKRGMHENQASFHSAGVVLIKSSLHSKSQSIPIFSLSLGTLTFFIWKRRWTVPWHYSLPLEGASEKIISFI